MPEMLDSSVEPATILALLRALLPPSDGPAAADESDEAKEASDAAAIEAGCSLWDMSANPALAQFMCEHGLLALLLRPIAQRAGHSGRLVEVALGCLANVVVDPALCASLGERDEAAALLCGVLLDCADAAVLTELVRLLATALSTSPRHCRGSWLLALRAAPVVRQLSHVVLNSLRPELVQRTAELLAALVYYGGAPLVRALGAQGLLGATLGEGGWVQLHWRASGEELLAMLRLQLALLERWEGAEGTGGAGEGEGGGGEGEGEGEGGPGSGDGDGGDGGGAAAALPAKPSGAALALVPVPSATTPCHASHTLTVLPPPTVPAPLTVPHPLTRCSATTTTSP